MASDLDSSVPESPPRSADRVLVLAFLACIALPGLLTPLGVGRSDPSRNGEALVSAPVLRGPRGIGSWLEACQAWLRVSFGLRQTMIGWDAGLKMRLALSASVGSPVTLGREGWLFYLVRRGTQGVRPELDFTQDELERWAGWLESRQRWLAERGVDFVLVVAPNKETIYPDLLPGELAAARPRSRMDVLLDRLRAGGKVQVVDVRPALREARREGSPFRSWPLYYRTDSHWNELGALLATRAVLDELKPRFPGLDVPADRDIALASEATGAGDLARMQGLQGQLSDVRVRATVQGRRCSFDLGGGTFSQGVETPLFSEKTLQCPGAPIRRALVLHDSMMMGMLPALAPAFERSVWRLSTSLEQGLVEQEKPDLVLLEFVERTLWEGTPSST